MSGGSGQGYGVDIPALQNYAKNLDYYNGEADKFGGLVDQADVTNESWGLIGLAVKQTYTDKLADLRDLLQQMKEGVDALTEKLGTAAAIYQGNEDDAAMTFGKHEAEVDGPRP